MVKSILKAAAGAAKTVASGFAKKERHLLPVLQKGQKLFVVEANSAEDFILPPKRHASSALISLFRGTEEKPGPIRSFNKTTNIVDLVPQYERKRSSMFVENGLEYDVVTFHLCTDLGQPKQADQIAALEEHGFSLRPLPLHPHAKHIKQALHLD